MTNETKKVGVIFSGGQDSTSILLSLLKTHAKEDIYTFTFKWGQSNELELETGKKVLDKLGIPIKNRTYIDGMILQQLYSSYEKNAEGKLTNIPGRNGFFIQGSAAIARNLGIKELYTGITTISDVFYIDCSKAFIDLIKPMIQLVYNIELKVPFQDMTKTQIWEFGYNLGKEAFKIIKEETTTCYNNVSANNEKQGCGECRSCKLRIDSYNEFMNQIKK